MKIAPSRKQESSRTGLPCVEAPALGASIVRIDLERADRMKPHA